MKVEVALKAGPIAFPVTFECPAELVADSGDSTLALSLLPSLLEGGPLLVERPVSERLLASYPMLHDVLLQFYQWRQWRRNEGRNRPAHRVELQAQPRPAGSRAPGVGLFFTAGLDSFYTLLSVRSELTHLVYVDGFDLKPDQDELRWQTLAALEEVAAEFGLVLVVVRSDLRQVAPLPAWEMYHGAALAAAGLLLRGHVHKLYLAGTKSCENLVPLGSHPLLDPLWSTHEVEFVHHGWEVRRTDKARVVGGCETALRHLRVCWSNTGGRYNCQRCEKCLRTMLNLELAGCHSSRLPGRLTPEALRGVRLGSKNRDYWWENLLAAREQGRADLIPVLERLLSPPLAVRATDWLKQLWVRAGSWARPRRRSGASPILSCARSSSRDRSGRSEPEVEP